MAPAVRAKVELPPKFVTEEVSQNEILERKTNENGQMMASSPFIGPPIAPIGYCEQGGNMNRILLSTLQSFVFVFVVSVLAFAAKAQTAPVPPGYGMSIDVFNKQSCDSLKSQVNDSYAKAQGYCGDSSKAETCMSNIKDCLNNNSSEDGDSSGDSSDDSDNSEQCYAFGYQNYKSDLKQMESDQKDSRKTLADLQKDKTSAQKDYNEQKAKLTQDQHDATDEYNKQTIQDKADQRKEQSDAKAAQDDLNKQQRDLQMQVLQKQNQIALLTSQRATQIDDYKMKLLQCKSDTLKYQASVANNTMGGLNGLSSKGGGAANDVQTYFNACENKVLKQRDDDANKYSVATTQLNAEIAQAQQQLTDVGQSLQMAQSQAQQQLTDDTTKSQQEQTSYLQKQQNVSQQMQDLTSNFMQQSQQLNQQILQAQQDNTTDSNSLKKFKGQSPPKTDTNLNDAYVALNKAKQLCADSSNWSDACAQPTSICNQFSGATGKNTKASGAKTAQ